MSVLLSLQSYFPKQGLLLNLVLTIWLDCILNPGDLCVSTPPPGNITMCTTTSDFYIGAGETHTGLHNCTARTLDNETSHHPYDVLFFVFYLYFVCALIRGQFSGIGSFLLQCSMELKFTPQ